MNRLGEPLLEDCEVGVFALAMPLSMEDIAMWFKWSVNDQL